VLAGLAGVTLIQPPPPLGPGLFGWLHALTVAESVALVLALGAGALAVAEAWLLSNLVRQNGRLMLRLDALEARRTETEKPVAKAPFREAPIGLPLNERAPEFTLPDLDGTMISLSDLRAGGEDVLLLFLDPGCGPCNALLPDVAKWRRQDGVSLTVAVISRGSVRANRSKLGGHDVGPVLLQVGDEVAERYQVPGTPAAVMVNATGRIGSAVAQGADRIRRLVGPAIRPVMHRRSDALTLGTPASVGLGLMAIVSLLGAGPPPESHPGGGPHVLAVEGPAGWHTWWRADSAPAVWPEPVQAVLDATRWHTVARDVDLGELVISGGSLALRTRIVLGRFDPRRHRVVLAGARSGSWTIDSADGTALLAFNGGQFRKDGPWGWLVRDGQEVQAPGWGPLSMAVAIDSGGAVRLVSFDSLAGLRQGGVVRDAFQSYPALLVDNGRIPDRYRSPQRLLDLGHRDTRLALCALHDGRLLVALTRFENLGRVFGSLPIGLTVNEMAAVMGALGCRRAVSLDGGLSAQLLVRPERGPARRWDGWRGVPLGIEVSTRP
jgi:peroxiredoxin